MSSVIFKPGRMEVFDNRAQRLSMSEIYAMTGCDYIIGGWVFNNNKSDPNYLEPYGFVRVDGQTLVRDRWHDWRLCAYEGEPPVMSVGTDAPWIISGTPILKNGDRLERDLTPDVRRASERQAVGWRPDGRMVLWCDREILSVEALQERLLSLGAVDALMLDGGGSVQGMGPQGAMVTSSRLMSNFICLWSEASADLPERPQLGTAYTVCLDPGHSASNTYNRSPDGSYYEQEFALNMALRIKPLLEAAGIRVIMTRSGGEDVSLVERCRISNEAKADLFVSLHSNATGQTQEGGWAAPRGLEVHVYAKTSKAAVVAQRIVQRMDDAGVVLRPYPVVERPSLYVLKHTKAPAVLIEHGFHTSREDVTLLRMDSYRQMLAKADAQGILDGLGVDYQIAGLPDQPAPLPEPEPPHEVQLWDQASPVHREAVRWAVERGIIQGNAEGDLMPMDPVTREQFCTMLHRALGEK